MIHLKSKIRFSNKVIILLALFFSLIISGFLANTVFIAGSPKINPDFFTNLINAPRQFVALIFNPMDQATKKKVDEFNKLPISALNSMGTGVYAKADKANNVVYIRVTKDAEWEEREINFQGKIMKVRFPKGTFK